VLASIQYERTIVWCVVVWGLVVPACTDERAKQEDKVLQYVEVKGLCRDDHANQSAEYTGNLVHRFNVTKNEHRIYGVVTNQASSAPPEQKIANTVKTVTQPYKYIPPFSIELVEPTPELITGESFTVKGISQHMPQPHQYSGSTKELIGAQYEATCDLRVLRRLDHLSDAANRG
jgi:hypothetical protein